MKYILFCLLWLFSPFVLAKGVYLTLDDFLKQAFPGKQVETIATKKYWLKEQDQQVAEQILYHKLPGLRIAYWQTGVRTAWVFDEIGKTEPITMGVVVEGNTIVQLHILEFRETRGWEVKYPFFRDQFTGTSLVENYKLSHHIDNLTGATLSVNAVKKVASLALYFHQQVMRQQEAFE